MNANELRPYAQKCRYCPALILFGRTSTGSWMPVDLELSDEGTVRVTVGLTELVAHVMSKEELETAHPSMHLRKPHFADCPGADQARNPR